MTVATRTLTHRQAASPRTTLALRIIALVCASLSLAALLVHLAGLLPMSFFLMVFGIPSVFLLFTLAALARWLRADIVIDGMRVGLLAGFAATIAYDGIRLIIEHTHIFGYNGFAPILIFGSWITGRPESTTAAHVVGWTYHYWNGLSFGIMYVLMFGKRHWLFGLAYGIVMELMMLGVFPTFIRVTDRFSFIAVSMIGHIAYGAVLGRVAQKYARF